MPLITRTRLIDTVAGQEHARLPGIVKDTVEAMRLVGPGQRLPPNQQGRLQIEHDLQCYIEFDILGTNEHGQLITEYSVWESQSSQQAGDPPVFENTHIFSLNGNATQAKIERHVRSTIIHHVLRGHIGNRKSPREAGRARQDRGHAIWEQAEVQALRSRAVTVDEATDDTPMQGKRRIRLAP